MLASRPQAIEMLLSCREVSEPPSHFAEQTWMLLGLVTLHATTTPSLLLFTLTLLPVIDPDEPAVERCTFFHVVGRKMALFATRGAANRRDGRHATAAVGKLSWTALTTAAPRPLATPTTPAGAYDPSPASAVPLLRLNTAAAVAAAEGQNDEHGRDCTCTLACLGRRTLM